MNNEHPHKSWLTPGFIACIVFFALVVAKVNGTISCSWLLVFSPFWMPFLVAISAVSLVFLWYFTIAIIYDACVSIRGEHKQEIDIIKKEKNID